MDDTIVFEESEATAQAATDYGLVLFDTSSSMNSVRSAGTDYGMLLFDTSSSMNNSRDEGETQCTFQCSDLDFS